MWYVYFFVNVCLLDPVSNGSTPSRRRAKPWYALHMLKSTTKICEFVQRVIAAHRAVKSTLHALFSYSYDLLNLTGATLPLRWNSSTGFFIQGMLVVQVGVWMVKWGYGGSKLTWG